MFGWKGLALPALTLTGAAALLVNEASAPRTLLAEGGLVAAVDQDMDGLPDAQELVMGTSPGDADTDDDGYSDLEELARQSDPSDIDSVPDDTPVNVGLAARTGGGYLYVSTALYLRHTETSGVNVEIGVMVGGVMASLPAQLYLANASIVVLPAKEPGDIVALLQTPYPEGPIQGLDGISFWSIVTASGETDPTSADSINLAIDPVDGTILAFEFSTGPGAGVYRPISSAVSGEWAPGQLCFQSSLKVGNVGPIAQHLIESATCEVADGYCSPGCTSLGGTSFEVVDALALLGG